MIVKVHKSDEKIILAVCDTELIGKKFVEQNRQLDLRSNFFKGIEMDENQVKKLMKQAYIINLVGIKSVGVGLAEGLVEENRIIKIDNIPHAQAVITKE